MTLRNVWAILCLLYLQIMPFDCVQIETQIFWFQNISVVYASISSKCSLDCFRLFSVLQLSYFLKYMLRSLDKPLLKGVSSMFLLTNNIYKISVLSSTFIFSGVVPKRSFGLASRKVQQHFSCLCIEDDGFTKGDNLCFYQ